MKVAELTLGFPLHSQTFQTKAKAVHPRWQGGERQAGTALHKMTPDNSGLADSRCVTVLVPSGLSVSSHHNSRVCVCAHMHACVSAAGDFCWVQVAGLPLPLVWEDPSCILAMVLSTACCTLVAMKT